MVLEALTSVAKREQYRIVVPVPRDIFKDSAFPFAAGERIVIRIDERGKRVVLEKAPLPAETKTKRGGRVLANPPSPIPRHPR